MRTIIITLSCLITASILPQNITNTLGSGGLFTIKDVSNNYLTLSQSTGQVNILKTLRLEYTTSSTTGIIFKGADRFIHNYGTANTFIGINTGNFTMTGVQNTILGMSGFRSNTIGNNNTAIGYSSLSSNSTGNDNIALGVFSLFLSSSGNYNIAIGSRSLNSNLNGSNNIALGFESMITNTTGYENTAMGNYSLNNNFTGYYNTAIGMYSMYSNSTGIENTAVGWQSLRNNTGSENTSLGYNSLLGNISGFQNTALGHHSLLLNNGNFNTAVGYNAGSIVTTGYNLTLLGIDANPLSYDSHDQITLGNIYVTSLRCAVTSISSLSDARDKKNIKDLSLGLDFITLLQPRQFKWDKREWYENNTSDGSKMDSGYTAGFIAQEFDELQNSENAGWLKLVLKDNPEKWEATPGNLLPVMVKAIQELKAENDELKKEIETLKTVEDRLAKLEQIISEQNRVIEIKAVEK